MSKVNGPCTFPLDLDLTPLISPKDAMTKTTLNSDDCSNSSAVYDLQSVVIHVGEYGSGHYYTYVRPDVTRNDWYRFNDNEVTKVDVTQVLQDAYGGKRSLRNLNSDQHEVDNDKINVWWMRLQQLLPWHSSSNFKASFGFGGPTANAYVLQYVKRRDIPFLYLRD
jgi:hypothetical protein